VLCRTGGAMNVAAAIYVATTDGRDPWENIVQRLAMDGFVPWPGLPPKYPAHPGETRELVYLPAADLTGGVSG
jgi:hypothetical protein